MDKNLFGGAELMSDDFGIYIHIPFCVKKCLYCDFLSFPGGEYVFDEYTDALCKEIKGFKNEISDRRVTSIFIGGGTPSLLPPKLMGRAVSAVTDSFNVDNNAEITIEANPGTLTQHSLRDYRIMGINRISMGLQAWQNRLLKAIGRIHTSEKFVESFTLAREAGFKNINTDIMFSLPGQTMTDIEETLSALIKLGPEHISAYSLIIEEGTELKRLYDKGVFSMPDDDTDREMYYYIRDFLAENGYGRYEISNFSKKGFESRHNSLYWRTYEYKGFGLGSHSYINGERYHNTCNMDAYLKCGTGQDIIKEDAEKLTLNDKMSEFMFMGLRMTEGVSRAEFLRRFGCDMQSVFGSVINKFIDMGLIYENEGSICLTDRGFDVSNIVFSEFLI